MADAMAEDLLALLPPLSRARDFRLYAAGGRRLVDLWQYGGGAILGHKPPAVLRELKNAAERGLFAPLPHLREKRLEKALARLFPGAEIRLYTSEASLRQALAQAGVSGAAYPFPDPALEGCGGGGTLSLWRPFLPEEPTAPLLVPILPWPLGPRVLVIRPPGGASLGGASPEGLPAAGEFALRQEALRRERISPVLLAAAARTVYDLEAAKGRGEPNFPRIRKALGKSPWRCRGIYLSLAESVETGAYGRIFRRFLEAGFLLPPDPGTPLILPGTLSTGEETKLAALLGERY